MFYENRLKVMVWGPKWDPGSSGITHFFTKLVGKKGEHGSVFSREILVPMNRSAHEERCF